MNILNFEFKARSADPAAQEQKLLTLRPLFKGEDHQTDTYFNIPECRLKLREGNIENALILYYRDDHASAKQSDIVLYRHTPDAALKEILTRVHGVKVVVAKKRRIYFIENVKFHFDEVSGLGTFIEVEAIDETGKIGLDKLKEQCDHYAAFLGVSKEDYVSLSYSDML